MFSQRHGSREQNKLLTTPSCVDKFLSFKINDLFQITQKPQCCLNRATVFNYTYSKLIKQTKGNKMKTNKKPISSGTVKVDMERLARMGLLTKIKVYEGNEPTLKEAQAFVGGYVEVVNLKEDGCLLVDEEGLLKNKIVNLQATYLYNKLYEGKIVGDVIHIKPDARREW